MRRDVVEGLASMIRGGVDMAGAKSATKRKPDRWELRIYLPVEEVREAFRLAAPVESTEPKP